MASPRHRRPGCGVRTRHDVLCRGGSVARLGHPRLVDLDDLPGDGGEQLGDRLDRLDGAELLLGVVDVSDLRELQIDDLAELLLGVIRDPDRADLAVDPDPLVGLGVVQVFGPHAGTSSFLL